MLCCRDIFGIFHYLRGAPLAAVKDAARRSVSFRPAPLKRFKIIGQVERASGAQARVLSWLPG